MSNQVHKTELSHVVTSTLNTIDSLPLHPKNKLLLYNRYLLSKISWHLTVCDLSKTWIIQHLDNTVSHCIRKWLDLPISSTLTNILLPREKFGFDIILPSTKFTQCQTVHRNALKSSPNEAIRNLWKYTSNNKNVQYDMYKNTKEVLKAVRSEHEMKLQNDLISQGWFFSIISQQSILNLTSAWSTIHNQVHQQYTANSFQSAQMGIITDIRLFLLFLVRITLTYYSWLSNLSHTGSVYVAT